MKTKDSLRVLLQWLTGPRPRPISIPDARLGFIMACFSQLAYTTIPRFEIKGCRSAKVVPSGYFQSLVRRGRSVDVARFLQIVFEEGEIRVETVITSNSLTILAKIRDVVIIASRGTILFGDRYFWPFHDVWIDLKAWRAPLDFVGRRPERYHSGFYHEALSVIDRIRAAYEKLHCPSQIYFTGHSLGGALSGVIDRLWENRWPHDNRKTILFGCPRFGNAMAMDVRDQFAYRRFGDPVVEVPPRRLGYADISPSYLLTRQETSHVLRWRNHKMERYRRSVASLCNPPWDEADFYDLLEISLMAEP